ncbi:MAG: TATA-box-binding protein [Candidatus Heimdallarchaeota archaeon]|nr:TATA-box-binding protein [Candidatus Heimdallarchaeota archaeon]
MVKIDYEIQNCVASGSVETSRIDLYALADQLNEKPEYFVSYEPEKFPGLVLKIPNPKVSSLIFASGKMVITGAKSAEMLHVAAEEIVKVLKAAGAKITGKPQVTVQNIVASGNINAIINLELASIMLEGSMYEPEQFPGLIYRIREPKTVLLLFQSGAFVCTGAKKEEFVSESTRKTYEILKEVGALEEEF